MADLDISGHKVSPLAATAIGAGSLVVIWFAWRQHQAAQSASSGDSSAIDPVTGLPYSQDSQTDPLTGMTYLQEAQEYGSVQAAEQATAGESAIDYSGLYGTGSGLTGTSTGQDLTPPNVVQGTTYGSNAAWAQAVESGLTDIGYSSTDVAAALGRYLANLSETSSQASIVQAGIAEYGPPPVGSYQVILASSGPSTTATVPNVIGQSTSDADSAITAAGLVPGSHAGQSGTVNGQNPAGGTKVSPGTTVDLSVAAPAASSGPSTTATVPNVTGKTATAAVSELKSYGFTTGVNGSGTVVSQTPGAGKKAAKGSRVDLHAETTK